MDQKSLQVFLAVHSTLSFTQTAADLHLSVSAVSRSIARLEEALGQTLFDRDRRGVRPTSAAQRLRPYAEKAVTEWRALRHSLREGADIAGELRIYCSVTASYRLLSPLLRAYREACPAVDVRLETGDQADGIERVTQGQADVAMIARPPTLPDTLVFASVARTPLVLCLPVDDGPAATGLKGLARPAFIEALADLPWILPQRGVTRAATDAWLEATLPAQPKVYARVSGHEAIAAMVSLGLGVGIVPRLVVEATAPAEGLEFLARPGLPEIDIGLCARAGRLADPVVGSLMNLRIF